MDTMTRPRVAGLSAEGHAGFAAHLRVDDPQACNVVWLTAPVMTEAENAYLRWATDAEVKSPHATLDLEGVSELLFGDGRDPEHMDDTQIWEIIGHQLRLCRADLDVRIGQIAQEYGDHPVATASHMNKCRIRAAALLGVSV